MCKQKAKASTGYYVRQQYE